MAQNERVLITGAAGFVGSHLARRCLAQGYETHVLLRSSSDTSRITDIMSRLIRHDGDITDQATIRRMMLPIKPTGVFHLAASNIMSGVISSPEDVIRINILGTVNLMDAAHDAGVDFFINTGTFLEYEPQLRPVRESDPAGPPEVYSISKLAATLYGQAMNRMRQMPVVMLRVFTPYGPGIQKGRLVYEVMAKAIANKEITLTAPTVSRDFIFVEDLAELYIAAAEGARAHAGEIFNAGTGKLTTLQELADLVLQITGSSSTIAWGKAPPVAYDFTPWQADMAKTFSAFSWRPRHDLSSGLEKTIDWYKSTAL